MKIVWAVSFTAGLVVMAVIDDILLTRRPGWFPPNLVTLYRAMVRSGMPAGGDSMGRALAIRSHWGIED